MSNNSFGRPSIIKMDNSLMMLERINYGEKEIVEGFLQDIIRRNPNILPINLIDDSYSDLICIGREASTMAGNIDNLLVTKEGRVVIVETKLWRNAEARREVIAQIIDYAKDLSKWKYQDFNYVARAYSKKYLKKELSLGQLVRESAPDFDEKLFHDNLLRNIEHGKFALLIVGDGIREGVEEIVEYLQMYATIHFTLGLIEIQLYKINKDEMLVVPQVILKTKEINRAIITVEGAKVGTVNVNLDSSLEVASQTGIEQNVLIKDEYLNLLRKEGQAGDVEFVQSLWQDVTKLGLEIKFNKNSFSIKPSRGTLTTISTEGEIVYYSDFLKVDEIFKRFTFEKQTQWPRLKDIKQCYSTFIEELKKGRDLLNG